MNSFNVYGQTTKEVGGNTPVWLGTVKPIPRGAACVANNEIIPAGTAVIYTPEGRVSFIKSLEGSGAAMLSEANGFVYNDIRNDNPGGEENATCAIVMHHPEGLLIERVYPGITEEQIAQLQSQIPGVLLVRG